MATPITKSFSFPHTSMGKIISPKPSLGKNLLHLPSRTASSSLIYRKVLVGFQSHLLPKIQSTYLSILFGDYFSASDIASLPESERKILADPKKMMIEIAEFHQIQTAVKYVLPQICPFILMMSFEAGLLKRSQDEYFAKLSVLHSKESLEKPEVFRDIEQQARLLSWFSEIAPPFPNEAFLNMDLTSLKQFCATSLEEVIASFKEKLEYDGSPAKLHSLVTFACAHLQVRRVFYARTILCGNSQAKQDEILLSSVLKLIGNHEITREVIIRETHLLIANGERNNRNLYYVLQVIVTNYMVLYRGNKLRATMDPIPQKTAYCLLEWFLNQKILPVSGMYRMLLDDYIEMGDNDYFEDLPYLFQRLLGCGIDPYKDPSFLESLEEFKKVGPKYEEMGKKLQALVGSFSKES